MKSTLTISDKYWHSVNVFYCKTYARGVFRTQSNIYNKAFLWFLQRNSTIDVVQGFKYASEYIYIQISLTEIICILNIFAVKYIFSEKEERNKVAVSELKKISEDCISYYLIRVSIRRFIPRAALKVKPNAKYSTRFLSPGATKGFKINRNSRYEIITKIVCLKIQANLLMNL